jgi:hypothetical protein
VGFQNCKPFSDFKHLIFKLSYPIKARLGPCGDLVGICLGLDRDPLKTSLGLALDLTETNSGLDGDLPKT